MLSPRAPPVGKPRQNSEKEEVVFGRTKGCRVCGVGRRGRGASKS